MAKIKYLRLLLPALLCVFLQVPTSACAGKPTTKPKQGQTGWSTGTQSPTYYYEQILPSSYRERATPNNRLPKVNYTILYPPFIFPGEEEISIGVILQPKRSPVNFQISASLSSTNGEHGWATIDLGHGESGTMKIRIGNPSDAEYTLNLEILFQGRIIEEVRQTLKLGQSDFVFIQTDKPIYKPEDTIKYRVLHLDRRGLPAPRGRIEVKVFDADNNLIRKITEVTEASGLVKGELELPRDPKMGEWKIQAQARGTPNSRVGSSSSPVGNSISTIKTAPFTVSKYVLPRFNVKVEIPKFGIISQIRQVPITVEAKYNYGENVRGQVEVKVNLLSYTCDGEVPSSPTSKHFDIDGSKKEVIDVTKHVKTSSLRGKTKTKNGATLQFSVTVTEDATGKSITEQTFLTLYDHEYEIQPDEPKDYYRIGLPFSIDFRIVNRHGDLIKNSGDQVSIEHTLMATTSRIVLPVEDGIAHLNVPYVDSISRDISIIVTYKEAKLYYTVPTRLGETASPSFRIALLQPAYPRSLKLSVASPVRLTSVTYILFSQDKILETLTRTDSGSNFEIDVPQPENVSGKLKVFVFSYIGKKYIGGSIEVVGNASQNTFSVSISPENQAEPGQNVTLNLASPSGSHIALRAIDKSVLQLQKDNDLDQNSLDRDFQSTESAKYLDLKSTGYSIASNFADDENHAKINRYSPPPPEGSCPISRAPSNSSSGGIGTSGNSLINPRQYFPETWLFDDFVMETDAKQIPLQVPDSLTSWVISGFSIHPTHGVNFISQPINLKVFKPFFITLDLPYSIVEGETLVLKVLIHNHISNAEASLVEVTIQNEKQEFQFTNPTKSVMSEPNAVTPVEITVTPLKAGKLNIEIKAMSGNFTDAILKTLRVEHRGETKVITRSKLLRALRDENVTTTIEVDKPEGISGPGTAKISIISDFMSSSMQNLERLIKLPVGCGEQNMLTFAVDLAVLKYLKANQPKSSGASAGIEAYASEKLRRDDGGIKSDRKQMKKLKQLLEKGYQQQLNFQRSDGSFAVFKNGDASGSTWLTALVIRYFQQAQEFIGIDKTILKKGLKFLADQQNNNGSFNENGQILDSETRRGLESNGMALTALCLLAFIGAAPEAQTLYAQNISSARALLKVNFEGNTTDSYSLAVLAYAAELLDDKTNYIDVLERRARSSEDDERKFWHSNDPAVSVEITSYVLLAYLQRGEVNRALPIVKWLLRQQNSNGGFHSTQDTAIALTALAKFAELWGVRHSEVDMKVHIFSVDLSRHTNAHVTSVEINAGNKDLLHEFPIDYEASEFLVKVRGAGFLQVLVTWTFHVEKAVATNQLIELKVEKLPKSTPAALALEVCARRTDGKRSMTMFEIALPSGYTFSPENFNSAANSSHRLHDVSNQNTKLDLYFDYLPQVNTCIDVEATRTFTVTNASESYIRAYDYYDPSVSAEKAFKLFTTY